MTLEQLRIFVAVAECEHVTQGARQLNLTQSATSAAIAALEERYATKLFDRIGRRIALNEAGRLFLKEAKAVLPVASAAAKVLTDLTDLTRGSLALGEQTVANYCRLRRSRTTGLRYPGRHRQHHDWQHGKCRSHGSRRQRRSRPGRGGN